MAERMRRQYAAARRALHKTLLDQEGFDNVLDGVARLGQRGGDRLDAGGAAAERKGDRIEIAPVHRIEPDLIDIEKAQHTVGDGAGDFNLIIDDREIANP